MQTPYFSRLLLSVARRLPVKAEKLYVPALGQVLDHPGDFLSVFNEIFLRRLLASRAALAGADHRRSRKQRWTFHDLHKSARQRRQNICIRS
jgi:hypothetical protein